MPYGVSITYDSFNSKINSISTGMFQGRAATPIADLAGSPISSPNTSFKSWGRPVNDLGMLIEIRR